MATIGRTRAGGLSFLQWVYTQLGVQRTSYLQSIALTETGGATPDTTNAGRSAARFLGASTNKLTSASNIVLSATGNSWFVFLRFVWNGFDGANNTCRIVGIGTSSIQVVATNISTSFLPDSGSPVNRQGGTVLSGENLVIVYGNRLTGNMETYLNGTSLGTNTIPGEFTTSRLITIGDSAANSRGAFDVLEFGGGDGNPALDILTSTMRSDLASATEFLDVAPIYCAAGGTATSALTFDTAILGGRAGANYTFSLEKADPKPASGYTTVGSGASRTGPGAVTITDPNAGTLAYYRVKVDSTTPATETFRTSNYRGKSAVHEVGNPFAGAAPTPQGVPAVGGFPLTSGMPRAIHLFGDSRTPVADFKTISAALTGRTTGQIVSISRSGSNWRHWQNGNTTYPPGIDIYLDFKTQMSLVGAQPGDWVAILLDVNALEAADAIGAGGYTDAVRNVVSQVVADGWVPKVILDPLSTSFGSSTFDNYETHQAVIAAAVVNAGGGAQYMTAGNVRRYFNSVPGLTSDGTHWNQGTANTDIARMIGADLLSLVALNGGTVGLPADQTGVSSLYVTSVSPATGGGSITYQWQDFSGTWADLAGETTSGNEVVSGIRAGATKLRRKAISGVEFAYSNELDISLSSGGGSGGGFYMPPINGFYDMIAGVVPPAGVVQSAVGVNVSATGVYEFHDTLGNYQSLTLNAGFNTTIIAKLISGAGTVQIAIGR